MDSSLSFIDAEKPENIMDPGENRRFRERQGQPAQHPSENANNFTNLQQFNLKNREFSIGMWVDAKDTIDQWLEAQVMDIRDNQVFIHYNGWGVRWDEWIDKNSARLAIFRSYTVQNPKSNYLSPIPNVLPDQRIP
jgi:hypothetical protein